MNVEDKKVYLIRCKYGPEPKEFYIGDEHGPFLSEEAAQTRWRSQSSTFPISPISPI